ncbi:threonine/serine exporter family protein [Leucobacter sp. CSA1]|uniref:Threonine/serine exporter family protein n=1 Tax=Leucobacter chromiisoli TaxID=2796471 RepID=A0A934Q6J4_9MICO|nr:threonine/serine exporter family protein [Leucobacter chromiisoli]MBK0418348.1 threonine/serine exporter family protein [Leucobacter chromiisoli]
MQKPRRRLLASVRRALHADARSATPTEALAVVDDGTAVRVLDLAMRIAESMLGVGASAHEVTLAATRVAEHYGLNPTHVDVTYNSITASFHRSGEDRPITLLRVVRQAVTDHAKLQRLQALVTDIGDGLPLEEARAEYRLIRRTPFLYRPVVVIVSRALLAVGVAVMFGASPTILGATFAAALAAAATQAWLMRLRVPSFFSQIAGALVITLVAVAVSELAKLGIGPFEDVRPSVIVASGIVMMFAGMTVVGAAQDAIDGFALTAGGRILELIMQTLGVVIGIVVGLGLTRLFGLSIDLPQHAQQFAGPGHQLVGAVVAAVAVALLNGGGARILAVSAVLSAIAMLGHFLSIGVGIEEAAASGIGALVASFVGTLVAHRLHVPSVAVTTAAIIPLVPGGAVFRGLLALAQSDGSVPVLMTGAGALVLAGMIGVGLAVGASLGLYLGTPVRATLDGVVRSRMRAGR